MGLEDRALMNRMTANRGRIRAIACVFFCVGLAVSVSDGLDDFVNWFITITFAAALLLLIGQMVRDGD